MVLTSVPIFSGCPSSISGKESGQFASPNYPNSYPNSENCSWGITVPDGFLVKVEFSHFSTEWNSDRLRIYDGPSASSPFLVTLTGDLSTPPQVISTGSSLWLNFRSDYSHSGRGFEATFTAVNVSAVSGKWWTYGFDCDDPLTHGWRTRGLYDIIESSVSHQVVTTAKHSAVKPHLHLASGANFYCVGGPKGGQPHVNSL